MIDPHPVSPLQSFFYAIFGIYDEVATHEIIPLPFHQSQQENYNYLRELQKFALAELKAGVIAKDFYSTMVSKVKSERPELEIGLPKTFGFGVRN